MEKYTPIIYTRAIQLALYFTDEALMVHMFNALSPATNPDKFLYKPFGWHRFPSVGIVSPLWAYS